MNHALTIVEHLWIWTIQFWPWFSPNKIQQFPLQSNKLQLKRRVKWASCFVNVVFHPFCLSLLLPKCLENVHKSEGLFPLSESWQVVWGLQVLAVCLRPVSLNDSQWSGPPKKGKKKSILSCQAVVPQSSCPSVCHYQDGGHGRVSAKTPLLSRYFLITCEVAWGEGSQERKGDKLLWLCTSGQDNFNRKKNARLI